MASFETIIGFNTGGRHHHEPQGRPGPARGIGFQCNVSQSVWFLRGGLFLKRVVFDSWGHFQFIDIAGSRKVGAGGRRRGGEHNFASRADTQY